MCTGCLPAAVCRLRIATLDSARSMPGLKWIMAAALSRFSLSNLHFHSACIHKGEQQFLPCRLNRNLRLAQRDWGSDWDGNREWHGMETLLGMLVRLCQYQADCHYVVKVQKRSWPLLFLWPLSALGVQWIACCGLFLSGKRAYT